MNDFIDESGNHYHIVYRAYRKDPISGKILYAKAYGFKAWPIRVYD